MLKFTLAAVRSFLLRHRFVSVRFYRVPCGCFGRHATVWDCRVSKRPLQLLAGCVPLVATRAKCGTYALPFDCREL